MNVITGDGGALRAPAAGPQLGVPDVGAFVPDWATDALATLRDAGQQAFLVGGFVRDAALGKQAHDIDIACDAPWETTRDIFSAKGLEVVETGTQHGTLTVLFPGEPGEEAGDEGGAILSQQGPGSLGQPDDGRHSIEITTFRTDGPYTDGRHPDSVRFVSSIEEDLARRDLTINAMAWNPERGLVDPFGGLDDLAGGIIRCVGEPAARFHEDGLRILRALRFASCLGFAIDGPTKDAIGSCASCLDRVSAERIGAEYDGIVCGAHATDVLRAHASIIARILPETEPMMGFKQHSRWHIYDVWEHCLHALDELAPEADRIVRHATLLHDIGKPSCFSTDEKGHGHFYGHEQAGSLIARSCFRRLRWRSIDIDRACLLIRLHDHHIEPSVRGVRRMLARISRAYSGSGEAALDIFRELMQVKQADTAAHSPVAIAGRGGQIQAVEDAFGQVMDQHLAYSVRDLALSGRDVMALGVERGPQVGRILRGLLDAVIDGKVENEREPLRQLGIALIAEDETEETPA